jgi:hypothetical protein
MGGMKYSLAGYLSHAFFVIQFFFLERINQRILYFFGLVFTPTYYKQPFTIVSTEEDVEKTIPKNLFLCYKDFCIPKEIIASFQTKNPDWKIHFYDDTMCRTFIYESFGEKMGRLFDSCKDGPIRGDVFRVCILYHYGGVYSDIDNLILHPLDEIIKEGVTFGLGSSIYSGNVNPAFLFSTQKNDILLNCIRLYETVIMHQPYSYWNYSIVYNMYFVLQKYLIRIENKSNTMILQPPKDVVREENCPSESCNNVFRQKIQFLKEDFVFHFADFLSCLCDPGKNFLSFFFLFDEKGRKIVQLHTEEYDSGMHCFL